jgi:ParB family chromosome partitioning protein
VTNSKTQKRLGRGLAALLGTDDGGFEPSSLESAELIHVAVDQIDPNPFQPRRQFDPAELATLADSLRQHGMLQPVLVRPVGERYQLIAGERRHRAAIEANLHEIPARVLELDDQRVSELAMVENLQREDLNAIEKASAFRNYLNAYGGTQEELAGRLGLDRSTLTNLLRLLDLPPEVQEAVASKKITAGHARALLGLDDPAMRIGACQRVMAEGLSVRQTEALVATGEPTPPKVRKVRTDAGEDPNVKAKAPHLLEWEGRLRDRVGSTVFIKMKSPAAHKGQIVIDFNSQEEFDRITGLFQNGQ